MLFWKIIFWVFIIALTIWLIKKIRQFRSRRPGWLDFMIASERLTSWQMPELANELAQYVKQHLNTDLAALEFGAQAEFLFSHENELQMPADAPDFASIRLEKFPSQTPWLATGAYLGELIRKQHPGHAQWFKEKGVPAVIKIDYADGLNYDSYLPFIFLTEAFYNRHPEIGPVTLQFGYRYILRSMSVNSKRGLRLTAAENAAWNQIITERFGTIRTVWHELVSPDIHCDVYVVDPPDKSAVYLITGGMSGYLMPVPDAERLAGVPERLELMVALPPDWPLAYKELLKETNQWPSRMLKDVARYPVQASSGLVHGHTVELPTPYGDTEFRHVLLLSPSGKKPEELLFHLSDEVETGLLQLIPIKAEEKEYLAAHGQDGYAPFEKMDRMISPHRQTLELKDESNS